VSDVEGGSSLKILLALLGLLAALRGASALPGPLHMAAAPSAATPLVNRCCGQAPAPGKVAH
jgi:hypothetical protein